MQSLTVVAWWQHLRDLQADKIVRALAKAPSASSLFIPTAQTVREVAKALPSETSPAPQEVIRGQLPEATRELAADNPFLLFARKCEQESYDLGLDPERMTPREVGQRRSQEIMALLEKHCVKDLNEVIGKRKRREKPAEGEARP